MAKINSYRKLDVSSESFPVTLILESNVTRYKIYGSKELSGDVVIDWSGAPKEGMMVTMDYQAQVTTTIIISPFGDYAFSIFGTKIPYSWLSKKLKIWCEYLNAGWSVYILPSVDTLPNIMLEMLAPGILDETTLSTDGTTGQYIIKVGGVAAAQLATDAVESAKIKAKAVTLAKMADLTRGSLIVGNSSGLPAELNAKTSGYIIVGDGVDTKSIAVSGDVTISSSGVVTIGANKVLSAMIAALQIANGHIAAAAGIVFTKMAAFVAVSKIPVINSSGFIEAGTVDAAKLAYLDVATPGLAEASKALVMDSSKRIDTLDITTPKIGGVAITATAGQINYLSTVTSDVQDQITRAATRSAMTILTVGTYTATWATLQSIYIADTGGGAVLLNLPLAETVPAGFQVRLLRVGGAAATAYKSGSDTLYPIGSISGPVGSIACSATAKGLVLTTDGVANWYVISYE